MFFFHGSNNLMSFSTFFINLLVICDAFNIMFMYSTLEENKCYIATYHVQVIRNRQTCLPNYNSFKTLKMPFHGANCFEDIREGPQKDLKLIQRHNKPPMVLIPES